MRLSYSSISMFNKCPFNFYSRYIAKKYKYEEPTEPLKRGTAVHAIIEEYLAPYKKGYVRDIKSKHDDNAIYDEETFYELARPYIYSSIKFIKGADGVFIELPLAIGKDENALDFFDKDACLVGIGDLFVVKGDKAFYFDWKTGKGAYPDDLQLDIMSYLFLQSEEARQYNIKSVNSSLVYVEQNKTFPENGYHIVNTGNLEDTRNRIYANIEEIKDSIESGTFLSKKSPLCNYCNSMICPFSPHYDPLIENENAKPR